MSRKKKRRLRGVTADDALEAVAAIERFCPERFKTKQYIPVCKGAALKFLDELAARGTTPKAIMDSANATDKHCETYKTGQYESVCKRVVGGFIRQLAKKRPGLAGRRR